MIFFLCDNLRLFFKVNWLNLAPHFLLQFFVLLRGLVCALKHAVQERHNYENHRCGFFSCVTILGYFLAGIAVREQVSYTRETSLPVDKYDLMITVKIIV